MKYLMLLILLTSCASYEFNPQEPKEHEPSEGNYGRVK
jgi:hypothetical protein